jgi:hypothetical protein
MTNSLTRGLVVAATVVSGMFGSLLDRALVATPAWDHLGARAWADYSRYADLGTGNIVYPIGGILLWALVLAAALAYRLDRGAPRAAGPPIYLAALSEIGAIATTIIAAPIMQGVGHLGDDPVALQHAFDQFTFWGVDIRGVFFVLIFLCTVWSLTVISRHTAQAPTTRAGLTDA